MVREVHILITDLISSYMRYCIFCCIVLLLCKRIGIKNDKNDMSISSTAQSDHIFNYIRVGETGKMNLTEPALCHNNYMKTVCCSVYAIFGHEYFFVQ